MLRLIDSIFSSLAPHYCLGCDAIGAILCDSCLDLISELQPCCYRCRKLSPNWQTCTKCRRVSPLDSVAVVTHYEGVAEALLHKLKFNRVNAAALPIARAILKITEITGVLLVPVPTATSRVRVRGYDQSQLIAQQLERLSDNHTLNLLQRIGQHRQTGSPRKVRLTQLERAFEVVAPKQNVYPEVLLIDDVVTTGSTLEAAARELKKTGVKRVHAVVFARAE